MLNIFFSSLSFFFLHYSPQIATWNHVKTAEPAKPTTPLTDSLAHVR